MHPPAIGFQNAPEQRDPVDLTIQGTIPPWLCGVLYRTGPGTYQIPTASDPSKVVNIQHWFDGPSMHHRFEIHPGGHRVSYRSRKACESYEEEISKQGKVFDSTFGQRPDICQTIFRKFFTVFKQAVFGGSSVAPDSPSGAGSIGVTLTPDMPGWDKIISNLPTKIEHQHAGPQYIVSKTDKFTLQLIDPVSLEPLHAGGYKSLDPRLDGEFSAAHSCEDKETNEFFNFSCKLGGRFPTYKVFKIKGDGTVDILAEVKDAPAAYLHSFTLTSKYVILIVWHAYFGNGGLDILLKKNMVQAIKKWNPDIPSVFYVIDRKNGGIVAKYQSPPFLCFHQVNAFDDPNTDDIVIDMVVYNDHAVLDALYIDNLCDPTPETVFRLGRTRRFRLPSVMEQSEETREAIIEFTASEADATELPAINPAFNCKPYRYAYAINRNPSTFHTFADRIIRLDTENRESGSKTWGAPGYTTSEPIFVPRPGGDAEDDGVVLSVVLDVEKGRSMLVILDAKDMKEVARAEMQTAFPIGFHGLWSHNDVAAL
ncbi:carotenoid cleavage dioxygenase 1 [Moniliophthora roreri]|nr:carotenoid cleavage dioxygenase 1 [Moniliophthora roreri]